MSTAAPVFKYLRFEVFTPVELEMIGRNRPGNFSIQRSCGSSKSLDSYHMSIPQLRECGSRNPYSLRTERDRAAIGTDDEQYACGIDINFPARRLQAFSKAMVEILRTNPPYARDLREFIYSPDGKVVMRWDAERGMASAPVQSVLRNGRWTEGDMSHQWHSHGSQYRSAATNIKGTAELVIRALHRSALIPAERMDGFLTALGVQPTEPPPEEPVNAADVKLLQQALNDAGANPKLAVDGDFGPLTKAAVAALPSKVSAQITAAETATRAEVKQELLEKVAEL